MVFSTIIFLFRFLPITLALYYLAPAKLKNTVLFVCSLVFYCWGEVRFFPVMLALILINYVCGLAIEHFDAKPALRKVFLLIALIGSLGMLFYFKYANFVLRSANALLGTAFAEIQGIGTLPLGISFYTFQTLSYTIDVYRRDVKAERNIIDFGAYVVMFPQLIAGPIVKYRDVSDQLHVYKHRYTLSQIEEGMTLFTFGLAKKVLLADAIGALWTDIIGVAASPSTTFVGLANASTPLVWLGIIAYSLQLYFDFSGYSMMGIGMGKMLGFDFPANFNYPYISASITEFWRRWHMTLSGWFREYVYIPLGGNRKGLKRQIFNLFVVELLTGIWHGANWNFICWGLYYFVLLALEKLFLLPYLKKGGWIITSSTPFVNIPNYPDMAVIDADYAKLDNVIRINIEEVAKENNIPRSANMILLGAAQKALGIEFDKLKDAIRVIFGRKGERVIEDNFKALELGKEAQK